MFLSASSTSSLREKKIWQNELTLWPHISTTNIEIRRLWHDIPRYFVQFLGGEILLLKDRKCKVCLPFQHLEIETGRHSNCFSYSTSGWASDCLVGVSIKPQKYCLDNTDLSFHLKTFPSAFLFFVSFTWLSKVIWACAWQNQQNELCCMCA